MTDSTDCSTQFRKAMPPEPWTRNTQGEKFEALSKLIEDATQSDLFLHRGARYEHLDDVYTNLTSQLKEKGQKSGRVSLPNGINVEVHQTNGIPNLIIFDDVTKGIQETSTFSETNGRITSDKVSYCGVSRYREFSEQGETKRVYSFPGGTYEKTGNDAVKFLMTPSDKTDK